MSNYGLKQTNLCTFCETQKETIKHLFYDCVKVQVVWYRIEELIKTDIVCSQIVLNNVVPNPLLRHVQNCIILIVKEYLYSSKCTGQRISYENCKKAIISYKQIEEAIVTKRNNTETHNLKWQNIIL